MEGHLRGIVGQLTVEQIVKEPEMVGDRMRATCAEDMSKMGLEVISFTIKEVRDKNEYIPNMGRPDVARIRREAESPPPRRNGIRRSSGRRRCARRRSPRRRPSRSGSSPRLPSDPAGRGPARP